MRNISTPILHRLLIVCATVHTLYLGWSAMNNISQLHHWLATHPGNFATVMCGDVWFNLLPLAMPAFMWLVVYATQRNPFVIDRTDPTITRRLLTGLTVAAAIVTLNALISFGFRFWGMYTLINGPVVNHQTAMYAQAVGPRAMTETAFSITSSLALVGFLWLVRADYARRAALSA
jgi:hypothetical protein